MRGELRVTRTMALVIATLVLAFAGDLFRYTVGWTGYLALSVVFVGLLMVALYRRHSRVRIWHLPATLVLFIGWCGLSMLWSRYPLETLMGWAAQVITALAGLGIAVSLTRLQFLHALGLAMRGLVLGSLVFEAFVAIWHPHGLIPPAYLRPGVLETLLGEPASNTASSIPANFYWSYGHLFSGGDIQGLPGNRNLLAMVALIALVITAAELWDRQLHWSRAWLSLAASLFVLVRTQSATVIVALAFVGLAAALVLAGRHLNRRHRWIMYAVVGTVLVVGAVLVVAFNDAVFAGMNRSSDMSGRGDIWRAVIRLGAESPVEGIGWISYWAPWLPVFQDLAVVDGTSYYQAHNSFIDVWLQTGAVGVILFAGVVFTALVRTWWIAIDRPDTPLVESARASGHAHLAGLTAVPFLVLVGLTVQSMTESRLIVEGGWLMLTYCAIYAKLRVQDPWLLPRRTVPSRTGPITVVVDPVRDV